MRRQPIIALLGVDGSGKTTQARQLAAWLNGQGVPARYFENAGGRPIWDALARRLGRADGRVLFGCRAYVVVEASMRWVAVSRALALSWLTGDVAVMDRYAYCQYAIMRARGDRGERRVRAAFRRFPAPDLVCYLSVPAGLAQRRVEQRGRDREELDYLVAFDEAYRSLPEASSFVVVPAEGSCEEVQTALRATVLPVLARFRVDGGPRSRLD
ncbi:Thymidylate kinase [Parafrankia sp. Ea1.12]|uniref:dTMP kinase n=1 Tax=Parafrankia sp. Ea1.12 TaxID=573499 RepID=UPI000DA4BC2D|nr:AAA family ATPase [Parafrankia sp. Ea1.12]SQE00456.1 Thymidylate kinase [Parafrankia sp. Ea1.12]